LLFRADVLWSDYSHVLAPVAVEVCLTKTCRVETDAS